MNQNDIYNLLKSLGIISNNSYSPHAYRKHKSYIFPILQKYNYNLLSENGSEHVYWIINDLKEYPKKCKTCGDNITKFHSSSFPYKFDFCSNSCAQSNKEIQEKSKETSRRKYGTSKPAQSENIKNKMKESNKIKYGVENYFQRSDLIRKSINEKYGVDYISQSNEIKEKKKQTYFQRYVVESPSQFEEFVEKGKISKKIKYGFENFNNREKSKETCISKYGVENVAQVATILEKRIQSKIKKHYITKYKKDTLEKINSKTWLEQELKSKSVLQIAEEINFPFSNLYGIVKKLNLNYHSFGTHHLKITKLLDELKIKYILNDRSIIEPKEIDILIPDYNLGIEINGLYFHSELFNKDKRYHLNKTTECEKRNIRLLHIFEDELLFKKDIVHSILSNILGYNQKIYARKTKIVLVDKLTKKRFLKENHIQGNDNSSIYLGLEYQNELVAIMTFCKSRFSKKHEWELTRFANKKNINVVGGASKLLKYFVDNYKPKNIISYADRRISLGNLYFQLGFQLSHTTPPNYAYVIKGNRKNRMLFQKKYLKQKLKIFDPNLSEKENMKQNKFYRIWDCGHLAFIKKF